MPHSQLLNFKQGHVIFNEGDETSEMYIIVQGKVQVFKSAGSQRKILLAELGPGSMIGEMSLISGRPRSATAIVVEDIKAKVVTKAIFDKSVQGIPPWAISIAKVLIERLRRINIIIKKEIIVDEFHAPEDEKFDYTKEFKIEYNHEANPGFIYLKGYFFKSDVSKLNDFITKLMRQKVKNISLDFSQVIDVDNYSINFLSDITNRMKQAGINFSIHNVQLIYTKVKASSEIQEVISSLVPPRKNIRTDEYLIRQGDISSTMYVVKEGLFKISRMIDGDEVFFAEIGAGDVIGEMTLFAGGKRSASVKAMKPSIVYEIKASDIQNNNFNIPEWFLRIIKQLINHIRFSNSKFDDIIKKKKDIFHELDIEIDYIPDKSKSGIFKLKGRLTSSTRKAFQNQISKLLQSGFCFIVLDFSDIEEIDKSFIPLFNKLATTLKTKGGKLQFINTKREVDTVLDNNMIFKEHGIIDNYETALPVQEVSEYKDVLTGLYKEKYFIKNVTEELERCKRYNSVLSLMMISIDNFYEASTTIGHKRNEYILEKMGEIINNRIRKIDMAFCNYGGVFRIILPGTDIQNSKKLSQELNKIIREETFNFNNEDFSLSCSFSITESKKTDNLEELLSRLNTAFNKAKTSAESKIFIQ
jgi:diguanylate cyclase (GGDEF)-like protein